MLLHYQISQFPYVWILGTTYHMLKSSLRCDFSELKTVLNLLSLETEKHDNIKYNCCFDAQSIADELAGCDVCGVERLRECERRKPEGSRYSISLNNVRATAAGVAV